MTLCNSLSYITKGHKLPTAESLRLAYNLRPTILSVQRLLKSFIDIWERTIHQLSGKQLAVTSIQNLQRVLCHDLAIFNWHSN